MAIVKHKVSKNARYADVLDYYTYKHEESQKTGHYEPILDENGLLQERDNYAVAYINAMGEEEDPTRWAMACMLTNRRFDKNHEEADRKNHEYIIAHPKDEDITVEALLEEGRAFAREFFQGSDVLIGAHDNHVHITINSVRAERRGLEKEWMIYGMDGRPLPCEQDAGGKHNDTPVLRHHMNDWLLEYTRQHGYVAKDNNAIADAHRKERHGSKNEKMKEALLTCAGKSRNIEDLQRLLKEEYDMDLKASATGKTISVLFPGNQKYVRLRTLGLEPTDLTRLFSDAEYTFDAEEREKRIQKEIEKREKQKYAEWLKSVRTRNNDKAEAAIEGAEEILAEKVRRRGERYSKEEWQDLRYLIRQTSYVAGNLQTELEKVDRLLGRWEQYRDLSLDDQERRRHGGYVQWCGCDQDSEEELEALRAEREIIEAQKAAAEAMNEALQAEALIWKGANNLSYSQNNLAWTKQRKEQLRHKLSNTKDSVQRLREIRDNCYRAALNYRLEAAECGIPPEDLINPKWANVYKFDRMIREAEQRQYEIEEKLREIRQKEKEAKKQLRAAKKEYKKTIKEHGR